jgi:hypothetical protein
MNESIDLTCYLSGVDVLRITPQSIIAICRDGNLAARGPATEGRATEVQESEA